ncbi:hypothetical protein [Arenibacter certesii]|uniref:Uncharacterized protein n=1 Tax=Arenibacter certesii TaxID=228955 RepID=A0A918MHL9_9FLAO|nr:hypothetical protein [Arenibacter certesii]GGW22881.1 hypothetical protein GCM10007383_03450 [Arenibacter certesii]
MKKCALFILTIVLNMGCTDRDDNLEGVHIRVKNESSVHFDVVEVGSSSKVHKNIAAGSFSKYLEYETAYNYSYINIIVGSENYTLQPIDYVGESPLKDGFYTYGLTISEEGEIELNFRID